jgi:arylsulfatase A-like enzyme
MDQPNIIFLMTDQQRWDALGVVNARIKTPNLDRLAREGVLFSQTVCQCPMCVPSRNSLMFGMYPSQLGVRSNSGGLFYEDRLPTLPLPEVLRRAGYQTAGFGKTHWGHGAFNPVPSARGFEIRAIGHARNSEFYERGAVMMDDLAPAALAAYDREVSAYGPGEEDAAGYIGCTSQVPARDHRDGYVAAQCLEFLDSGVDPARPLFLYLSFLKPHAGFNVPPEFEALYDLDEIPDMPAPDWNAEPVTHQTALDAAAPFHRQRYEKWRAIFSTMTPAERKRTILRYYANCSWLDACFGQALERLEKLGRLNNALIVFTSDHGDLLGERDYRFSKYCLFESSVRVPLILAGSRVPGTKRGTVDDRPAELVDLVPTLAQAAGAPPNPMLPGLDLLSENRRLGAFCELHGGMGETPQPAPAYMWRKRDWKLILYLPGTIADAAMRLGETRGELYDLAHDPQERTNLYPDEQHAVVREQMKTELLMHLAVAWSKGPLFGDAAGLRALGGDSADQLPFAP